MSFARALRDLLAFLADPAGDGLLLTGPTGAGKTSLVLQVAARLNWPVQEVTCHGRLELSDLIGQFVLKAETRFVHGPLAVAAREGHLLVLNELDVMDAAELAGLNDIVEGAPLVIAANGGEVIRPHPKFRLIATGNSTGSGDPSGLYQGVLRQNLAFLDRFRVVRSPTPTPRPRRGCSPPWCRACPRRSASA
jgi:cobaltochelatase CobS